MLHKFTINGQKGDAFIRITSGCKDVQVVFCENEDTVQEEVTWENQQAHKTAMIFAQIIGEYLKLTPYYDELVMKGENLAAELLGQELTPTFIAGEPLDDEDFGEITFEPDFDLNSLKDMDIEKAPIKDLTGDESDKVVDINEYKKGKDDETDSE